MASMPMFDDNDTMLFGDTDFLGTMPACQCLAGELELQVASFECGGDLVGESPANGKSFSLTKDSGGSSLSGLAVADFGSADFNDFNVSLEVLAAADHYGHTVCGRQSTADSAAAPSSARNTGMGATGTWDPSSVQPAPRPPVAAPAVAPAEPAHRREQGACVDGQQYSAPASYQQQQPYQQQQREQGPDSSDGDTSHSAGDGETSGVGHGGKGLAAGSQSEESEDNMQGIASAGGNDEEHMSEAMPNFGLSLSRLRQVPQSRHRREEQLAHRQQQQEQQQHQVQAQARQQQQNPSMMTRAYSVGNMALAGAGAGGAAPGSATFLDGQRRAQMFRSYSFISPDCLPEDFELGCGGGGGAGGGGGGGGGGLLGARGRCASLNETQLRRQWLHEGELLAPQLPPSVSELELLELPEDAVVEPPLRPLGGSFSAGSAGMGGSGALHGGRRGPGGGGMMLFRGASGSSAGGGGSCDGPLPLPQPGTVKRKIITSPSPLLHAHKPAKVRQAAAGACGGAGGGTGSTPKGQSPKRAKVGSAGLPLPPSTLGAAWQQQDGSAAGVLAGWHPPPAAARGGGMMKSIRSVPANMNSMAAGHGHGHGRFLDGIEVAARPLGPPGASDAVISPNCSAASAGTPYHGFGVARGAGSFAEPVAPAGRQVGGAHAAAAAGPAKISKARGAAVPPPPVVVPGTGLGLPFGGAPPSLGCFPEAGRRSMTPSVPKPRKRASPNGNPPKAPAPNPNGHCCTQCGTQTTPVWRAGPHGPKTLCNACGVRYMKVAKGNVPPTPRKQQQQQQHQ